MAGDWIKMRVDLQTHPKVFRMASALNADKLRIIGGLHSAWCLFDVHADNGVIVGYTRDVLDHMIGWPGFSDAMISVGWLDENDESLSVPRFDAHNGKSAKRRATDSDRKRIGRLSAQHADTCPTENGTREEKRREEIKPLSSSDDQEQLSGANDQVEPVPSKQKSPKGSRWKSDDPVPTEWLDDAIAKGMSLAFAKLEAEKFVNYWTAATGSRAVKADWRATWRNWVISALARAGASGQPVIQQVKPPRAFGA